MNTKRSFLAFVVFLSAGCSSGKMLPKMEGPLIFGSPAADWYAEFPATGYFVVFDTTETPLNKSVLLRHPERKMTIRFELEPAAGRKTSSECRDFHNPKNSFLIDSSSIVTYEKNNIAYLECYVSPMTGYAGRYIRAFILRDAIDFSVMLYISDYDESIHRSFANDILGSIKFKKRAKQIN